MNISCNEATTLPSLENLKKLQYFYGQQNNFTDLPDFVGCEQICEIYLANNNIQEIPKEFCEALPHLKILDLKNNKINQITDDIKFLSSLTSLELANNNITTVPTSISTLKSLVRTDSNSLIISMPYK